MPKRVGDLLRRQAEQLGAGGGGAEHGDGAGRMKSALTQFGMAGARDRGQGLVAGDDRLDQRLAVRLPGEAEGERRRHHGAAGMRRALGVAVVELDAVRRGAAEKGGVDEIGAARAPWHRDLAGRANGGEHGFGAACDRAARARDHHPDGVEQVPARIVTHLVGERGMPQPPTKLTSASVEPAAGWSV